MTSSLGRRLALLALIVSIGAVDMGGCARSGGSGNPLSGTFRATLHYLLGLGGNNLANVFLPIMTGENMDLFQNQSGATQTAGNGFVYCAVLDSTGTPIAGASVEAVNDGGVALGSVFYKTASGFNGTTSTNSSGLLIIFNLPPGRFNLRATGGATGNLYVQVEADGTTSANLIVSGAASNVKMSGKTRKFGNTALLNTPEPSVNILGIGTGSAFTLTSDGLADYTTAANSVRANNLVLLRLTKAAFIPTLNYVQMGTTDLSTDLNIVDDMDTTNADFNAAAGVTAGTGAIRGKLSSSGPTLDGFTITCTDLAGAAVGTVEYGSDAASGAPSAALTATQTLGVFYVHEVPPGLVLLRATKSGGTEYAGSVYAYVEADSVTLLHPTQLPVASAANATISVSGFTAELFGGTIDSVGIAFRGLTNSTSSNQIAQYTVTGMPANAQLITRCTK